MEFCIEMVRFRKKDKIKLGSKLFTKLMRDADNLKLVYFKCISNVIAVNYDI